VIHLAQRPGPATGLPTRTEQGDLNLAIHAGHGDFLKVVLAPGDLEEGFELALAAFDLADRYQSPVFVLTDQYYVDSYYTTRAFSLPGQPPSRATVRTGKDYKRFAFGSSDGISPRGLPGVRARASSASTPTSTTRAATSPRTRGKESHGGQAPR
jgi:2-oxoglutarate ferredoxin oxidoreductase subunit alpha